MIFCFCKTYYLKMSSLTKTEQKALDLRKEIFTYFENNKYLIKTDINTISAKSHSINYICSCGKEKHKSYKDMLLKPCKYCKNKNLKEKHEIDETKLPSLLEGEKWEPIEGGFISNKGRACNTSYKLLEIDERDRYFIKGKHQYITILMAKAFNIKDVDKLNGNTSSYVVRCNGYICLDNIYIGTRTEIGKENGEQSRKSENFQEKLKKDIIKHAEKYSSKILEELPNHIIFEDGNIYSKAQNRFLTFSKSSDNYIQFTPSGLKNYKVHRLVCMAFKPIEGFKNYDDYKNLQVNHIDGNTLNNHKDNLEWTTPQQNMQHAYDTRLNKKVRIILQYKKNSDSTQGELLKEYESIAKAARECQIPEHVIRETARGKTTAKEFIWKYKNEEQNEEWTKKYSSYKYD